MNTYLVVRHRIGDFSQWKKVFDESEELRRQYGLGGGCILRDVEDSREITVVLHCLSVDRAREFMALDSLKDCMRRGGVQDQPTIMFVERAAEVAELVAAPDAGSFC